MVKIPRSFGTHDGTFHADELTACALLLVNGLIDEEKILRSRDLSKLHECEYVCDVGGSYDPAHKNFDHHQASYQGDLSSAGMVLKYLKDQQVIDFREYAFLNDMLVIGVDAYDNGRVTPIKGFATFSSLISQFNPVEHQVDKDVENRAFKEALQFVKEHLGRLKVRYRYFLGCLEKVEACMKRHEGEAYLIFEESLSWLESFFELGGEEHSARFVVMPSGQHWKLRAIPPSYERRMDVRAPLPLEWAGLLDEELKAVSGIEGAIFCHKGRFISVWESKEDALQALDYVLSQPCLNP